MQDKVTPKRVFKYSKEYYLKTKDKRRKYNEEYRLAHLEEAKEWQRNYRANHKKEEHNHRLKRLYGITYEQYSEMLVSQSGNCAICFEPKKLVVDHCHATGKVRGLLCTNCNFGIGNLKDSLLLIESAKKYLINTLK